MDLWYVITLVGQPEVWLISTAFVMVAYWFFRKKLSPEKKAAAKKLVTVYILSILLAMGLVFVMKSAIQTERPCVPCILQTTGCNPYCSVDNSFPSGHSAAIFAVFSSVYIATRKRKLLPLFVIPFLVAASRYVLGVHNIEDIIAGSLIGVIVPVLVYLVYEKKLKSLIFVS
jgi:membrane-associated phospholipid phosphatase